MAGDHKCPVCNSTFTRPQHVARHMRSHTGDRPYKCTTCGDAFARSDLLSRHVNKCHAADRGGAAQASSRRRGATQQAAAVGTTRAYCDQCTDTNLLCDFRAPCSACTERKIPCTYSKPRQARRAHRSGLSGAPDQLSYPHDPTTLYPPHLAVPSLTSSDQLFSGQLPSSNYSFQQQVYLPPLAAPDLDSFRAADLRAPAANQLGSSEFGLQSSYPHLWDLNNAGSHPSGSLLPLSTAQQQRPSYEQWSRSDNPPYAGTASARSDSTATDSSLLVANMHARSGNFPEVLGYESSSSTGSFPSPQSLIDAQNSGVNLYNYSHYRGHSHSHSDSGGTQSDFSTSSSPAVGTRPYTDAFPGGPLRPPSQPQNQPGRPGYDPQAYPQHRRGDGALLQFGHMTLADGTLPGQRFYSSTLGADGGGEVRSDPEIGRAPGWSHGTSETRSVNPEHRSGNPDSKDNSSAQADPTDAQGPTAEVSGVMSPNSEARQMREFWKAFIQTPEGETPGKTGSTPLANGRPGGWLRSYSMTKTNSLPPTRRNNSSVDIEYKAYDDSTPHPRNSQQLGAAFNPAAPPRSAVNSDELRSYEAAVMSRSPLVLKFEPRAFKDAAGGLRGGGGTASDSADSPASQVNGAKPEKRSFAVPAQPNDGLRPSYKRLPSTTLGPESAKRPMHTHLGRGDMAPSPSGSVSGGDGDADAEDGDGVSVDDSSDDGHHDNEFRPRPPLPTRMSSLFGESPRPLSIPAGVRR